MGRASLDAQTAEYALSKVDIKPLHPGLPFWSLLRFYLDDSVGTRILTLPAPGTETTVEAPVRFRYGRLLRKAESCLVKSADSLLDREMGHFRPGPTGDLADVQTFKSYFLQGQYLLC